MNTPWQGLKYKLWAKVGGIEIDVSQCRIQHALNSIPTAMLGLPLGRSTKTLLDSGVHSIDWNIKQEIEVFVQLDTVGVLGALGIQLWGRKPIRIFLGDTNGRGADFVSAASQFVVQCEHWLARLAFTSAISAVSVPSNPESLTFNSVIGAPAEVKGKIAGSGNMTGLSYADTHINQTTISSDFWGQGIKPFFAALTGKESIGDNPVTNAVIGLTAEEIAQGNVTAKSALDLMEPIGGKYEFGTALKFNPVGYGGQLQTVAEQISSAISGELLEAFAGTTLWDKLLAYAGNFLFAVVPLVETALVVPVIPGLRKTWKTINGAEYSAIKFQGGSVRPLRGVGIYGGHGLAGGGGLQANVALDLDGLSVGGFFQGGTSGQVIFKNSPSWMSRLAIGSLPSQAVSKTSGSALFPALTNATEVASLTVAAVKGQSELMNAYAQALYAQEVLKTRSLDLTGRFRIDICPGSTVQVQIDPRKFLNGKDRVVENQYGTVIQVDHYIDGEAAKASTSMHVSHLRGESENSKLGYSIERHPLWDSSWNGAPLAKIGG